MKPLGRLSKFSRLGIGTIVITLLLAGCGGGGGGGGGVGSTALATGTFIKAFSPTPGAGGNFYPFSDGDAKVQGLYLASEINGAGNIASLRFQFANTGVSVSCPNTTIKLGHSNVVALVASFATNVEVGQGSLAIVFNNATLTIPAGTAGAWFDILLRTSFQYNGVDNLVVQIEHATACSATLGVNFIDAGANMRALSSAPDNMPGTAEYSATTAGVDAAKPLVQFVFAGGDNVATAADGAGSDWNGMAPGYTGRSQFLILASDINGNGPITGIQFRPNVALAAVNTGTYKVTLSQVPMATTALASTTFATNVGKNATVVANGVSVSLPKGTREWWIPLSGSFNYDGTSNLLIDVEATVTAGAIGVEYQVATGNRTLATAITTMTTGVLFTRTLEPKLRFNGGQLLVVPPSTGVATLSQILGSGQPGQVQSLYRNDILGSGGSIKNVYVRLGGPTPEPATLSNYKLYMGHTAKTSYLLADTYASNMTENALIMSGTLTVPAGLKMGDWVKIPLNTSFAYDSSQNLSILFTTDTDGGTGGNIVSTRSDSNQFAKNVVARNDNDVTSTTPMLLGNGIVDLKLDLVK